LIVFDAIAKLKTKGININLVCTGAFSDYRNPEYSDTIKERITSLGISDNINLLGMVDRDVFNSLLGESALLINPSLFEGWSTTVEEGKMASKSMLLSDIPVHREQVETYPVETLFFSPSSIDSCSEQLVHAMKSIIEPSRKVNPEYCEHHTYTEILNRIINESN
jgi:glycosyltransferase involved in cell wall biosynthesis